MNFFEPSHSPQIDLAQGFAAHVVGWARRRGAPLKSLEVLETAAAQASLATAEGHVCALLDGIAAAFPEYAIDELRTSLLASGIVGTPEENEVLPLVLDAANRLYLRRYFDYERRLAAWLLRRAAADTGTVDGPALRARLDALFAPTAQRRGDRPDWQKLAAALAAQRTLTVISGAPGTGKTTTVAAVLACLLEQNPAARIALAAPTGKAAARMLEALRERAQHLPPQIRERLPRESYTIHRLLGATAKPGRFRHHAANLLPLDALVVDEASMLDLALAVHLVEAMPDPARLILLGDKDQLAAVEAGAVFAELSADPTLSPRCVARLAQATGTPAERILPPAPTQASPLADTVVWLTQSHRFAADSGIGRLAADINAGAADRALEWMVAGADASVSWIEDGAAEPAPSTRRRMIEGYGAYLEALRLGAGDKAAIFAAFDRFRVLCAVRDTGRGVDALNALVSDHVRAALDHPLDPGAPSPWYPGRPVMILRNDYVLGLYNGDVGICLPGEDDELMVWFAQAASGFRCLAPLRLPEHDTAYATTVHKSQGSQFGSVLLLLPEQAGKVMTRELVYTAVTRAAQAVTLIGAAEVFRAACARPTLRHAGLIDRMRHAGAEPTTAG